MVRKHSLHGSSIFSKEHEVILPFNFQNVSKVRSLSTSVAKEFLVFDTLSGCPFAPEPKAGGFEGFSHVSNYFAFGESSNLTNFLKGDAVGPGSPDDPIRTFLGGFRFFYPGNGTIRLLGIHYFRILGFYLPVAN
jgi:hypothetical protein